MWRFSRLASNRTPVVILAMNGLVGWFVDRNYFRTCSAFEEASSKTESVPKHVQYLLVGGGTASYYAALSIRAKDADAKVLMVGEENHLPYNRPPLSKELWWYGDVKSGQNLKYKALSGKVRDVFLESQGFFVPPEDLPNTQHGGVSILKGRRVVRIDPNEKKAFLEDGTEISYNKCLLATGGRPKSLKELEMAKDGVKQRILVLRGVDDYRNIDKICSESKTITVVGGGFLGSELAYGIKRKYPGLQVIQEKGCLARVFPEFLAKKSADSMRKHGVNVIAESRITGAEEIEGGIEIEITGPETHKIKSDYLLVATGIVPDVSVAEASGLEVDSVRGGVLADSELRVCPGVYAAGDACSFYDRTLGRRRVEHWEHAQVTGRLAGENMTGGEKLFWFQSSYFTKISPDYHINAVGNTDSSLETISVFAKDNDEKYERGVIFYRNGIKKIVGVLMVNVFGSSLDVGRRLIEDGRVIEDYQELSKLFPLFELSKENTLETEEDLAEKKTSEGNEPE